MIESFKKISFIICLNSLVFASNVNFELSELTAFALKQSPVIEAQKLKTKMSSEKSNQVGMLPDPMLTYSYFGESVETKVGSQEQKFSIQQKIPWLGKLFVQKDVARKNTFLQSVILSKTQANTVYQVRSNWADVQYLLYSVQILDSTRALFETWKAQLIIDFQVGKISYSRVIKMENEIENIKDDIQTKLRMIKDKESLLSSIVGLQNDISLKLELNNQFIKQASQSGSVQIFDSIASSPSLKTALVMESIWTQKKELSFKQYMPDFSLGFSYIQTGEGGADPESGKDPWIVSVGMTLPLSFEQTSSQIRESAIGIERAKASYKEAKLSLLNIEKFSKNQIKEAHRKRELYSQTLLPNIEQSISVQITEYQTGSLNFMQLLDDYRMRLNLHQKIFSTYQNEFLAKAKLLWLIGDYSEQFNFVYCTDDTTKEVN